MLLINLLENYVELKSVNLEVDDLPFVTLTLSRREAKILRELLNYDINRYEIGTFLLDLPPDANVTFAQPTWKKLNDALLSFTEMKK